MELNDPERADKARKTASIKYFTTTKKTNKNKTTENNEPANSAFSCISFGSASYSDDDDDASRDVGSGAAARVDAGDAVDCFNSVSTQIIFIY